MSSDTRSWPCAASLAKPAARANRRRLANRPQRPHLAGVKWFLQRWAVTAIGVLLASKIVNGIHADDYVTLAIASLLLGIFNAFLRPVMLILSLPLLIFTLGLFTLVINAALLGLVAWMLKSFHVAGFWAAFWGGVIISLVSFFANGFIGRAEKRPEASDPPPSQRPPPGRGPIIDV